MGSCNQTIGLHFWGLRALYTLCNLDNRLGWGGGLGAVAFLSDLVSFVIQRFEISILSHLILPTSNMVDRKSVV